MLGLEKLLKNGSMGCGFAEQEFSVVPVRF